MRGILRDNNQARRLRRPLDTMTATLVVHGVLNGIPLVMQTKKSCFCIPIVEIGKESIVSSGSNGQQTEQDGPHVDFLAENVGCGLFLLRSRLVLADVIY
jgi:hypothetical protein